MRATLVFGFGAMLVTLVACGGEDEGGFLRTAGRSSNETSATAPKESPVLTPTGASCTNGVKDGDESDVDCGGGTCPVCANGDACNAGPDCASRVCTANKCTNDVGCADGTREGFA